MSDPLLRRYVPDAAPPTISAEFSGEWYDRLAPGMVATMEHGTPPVRIMFRVTRRTLDHQRWTVRVRGVVVEEPDGGVR